MKCKRDIRFLGFTNFLCFLNSLKKWKIKIIFTKMLCRERKIKTSCLIQSLLFSIFLYLKKNYFIIQYNFPLNMTTVHHRHI